MVVFWMAVCTVVVVSTSGHLQRSALAQPAKKATALATGDSEPPDRPSEAVIDDAKIAYVDGGYGQVVELLEPFVISSESKTDLKLAKLPKEAQVEVLRLLGVAYLLKEPPEPKKAERVFVMLLKRQPDFQLVQGLHPEAAIEMLEEVKIRYADELPDRGSGGGGGLIYIQREVERNEFWLALMPFGVGQYQNEDMFKFWLFCGIETAALAVNVTSFTVVESLRGSDGLYTPENRQRAEGWQTAQLVSVTVLGVVMVVGIIDAIVFYEPEKVRLRTLDEPPPELTLRPPRSRLLRASATSDGGDRRHAPIAWPVVAPPPQTPEALCRGAESLGDGCFDAGSSGITFGLALPF